MADISNVDVATIRDLYTRLESLPCTFPLIPSEKSKLTVASSHHDPRSVLNGNFKTSQSHRLMLYQLKTDPK
jgi:hypothetical protein